MSSEPFQPKIVALSCNWGAYSAVDRAGVERMAYPASVKVLRLQCIGNVNAGMILNAFELGADGVMMLACASGTCHHQMDECATDTLFESTREIIGTLGIGESRLRMERVADYDRQYIVDILQQFTDELRKLGPSPLAS